jgi:preprotein translocase SecE subunit
MKKTNVKFDGVQSFGTFISDVRAELAKAQWPTREQATKLTVLVIIITLVAGFILGLFDSLFSVTLTWLRTLV